MPDNYRALTRTYRPHTFDDIVSQEHVSSTLKNAIKKNRLAHAYMFSGPRGVGKTTMARVLARSVNNIEKDVDGEALNQTLNIIEIDAASNNGVDDIRDLRDRVRIPPQNGRYKIYIIDEVHMLSKAAFNALLKTLEEPPDHVIFIFATTEPHKVLPTILSRVQRFDFKRISIEQIVVQLKRVTRDEGIEVDEESLHVIAKKADGALRDALGLLDQAIAFCGTTIAHDELLQALNVVSTDRMFELMETVVNHDAAGGLALVHHLLQEGYDIQEFLVGLTEHLRNLYVAQHSDKMYLVEGSDSLKKRYLQAGGQFSEDDLMRMLHIVSDAQYKIKEAHQPKIQLEITVLKLIHMERSQKLDTLLSRLEQLKKKDNLSLNTPETPGNGKKQSQQKKEPQESTVSQNGETQGEKAPKPEKESSAAPKEKVEEEPTSVSKVMALKRDSVQNSVFGAPSLQKTGTKTAVAEQVAPAPPQEESPAPAKPVRKIDLPQLKGQWEEYITQLRQHLPQMLYFQMQRVEPVKLKNGVLWLRCNDDFAKNMVEENNRKLAKILEKNIGVFLQFKCQVKKKAEDVKASMSPYERFKKLQERDPRIKTLVELFGAELDYNLNH